MKNFELKKVENCFGSSNIYEYRLGIKVDDDFLACLSEMGSVKCKRNFPRPFFQATLPDGTTIKGVIADVVIKVSYTQGDPEGSKQSFEVFLHDMIEQRTRCEER